jgi:hypothetical protein
MAARGPEEGADVFAAAGKPGAGAFAGEGEPEGEYRRWMRRMWRRSREAAWME